MGIRAWISSRCQALIAFVASRFPESAARNQACLLRGIHAVQRSQAWSSRTTHILRMAFSGSPDDRFDKTYSKRVVTSGWSVSWTNTISMAQEPTHSNHVIGSDVHNRYVE